MLYLFKPMVWVIDVVKIFKRTQGIQDSLLKNIYGMFIKVSSNSLLELLPLTMFSYLIYILDVCLIVC